MNTRPLNQRDLLKLLALLLMVIDHLGLFIFPQNDLWRAVGRGAAPIFLYLVGFASSYRFDAKLVVLAAILSVLDIFFLQLIWPINILWTIILMRLIFARFARGRIRPYEWLALSILAGFLVFFLDYGGIGMAIALAGYLHYHQSDYSRRQRAFIHVVGFALFTAIYADIFHFHGAALAVAWGMMAAVGLLLWRLDNRPIDTSRWPRPATWLALFASRQSALLYVGHFAVFALLKYAAVI